MAIIVGDGFKLDGPIPVDLNYIWNTYSIVPSNIIFEGKLIYDSSSKSVMFYNGTNWKAIGSIGTNIIGTVNNIPKWVGDSTL